MFDREENVDGNVGAEAPARLHWIVAFFVLSGLTGLIYQSTWTQYLSLVLGSAAYAQSLVLAIFMGGMAIGSWIASRYAERLTNLLWSYGAIEGVVGVFALAFHWVFVAGTALLYDRWIPGLEDPFAIDLARWAFAALMILPQTILLGMTFPIMSAGLMRWLPERAGAILGGLYFLNSAGAAIGALVATFVLVPAVGLTGTLVFAGLINLLIFACVVLAKFPPRGAHAGGAAANHELQHATPSPQLPMLTRLMLLAAAMTGLSSFMYEIGWVRMLSLALGTSLHAFELMLAAFIGGLALGALYVRRKLDDVGDAMRFVGWVQVLMGCAALATLPLYDYAFVWVGTIFKALGHTESGYALFNVASAAVAIAIMLPAAFFAGTTLPSMTYVLLRHGAGERVMGQVYSANTLGAIVGVVLMMHWALPALGLKYSMIVAAAIDIALGLAVLVVARPRVRWVPAAAVAAIAVFGAVTLARFDPRLMNSGVYRHGLTQIDPDSKVVRSVDGKTASIALYGTPKRLTIATNGKPDASISMIDGDPPSMDEPTMIMIALLALAYHGTPDDIANIGFGSGLTAHTFASSSKPKSITTVEIEPMMVDVAKGFGDRVALAYTDPRSHVVIDDARAYFSGHRAQYDLITSEPSNPWVNGVAKLFSIEFYSFAKRHLKPGGLFLQWVQMYEMSDATALTLLRSLDASFDDYALYIVHGGDMVVVASPNGPLPAPNDGFLKEAGMQRLNEIAGIRSLTDLTDRRIADRRVVSSLLLEDGGPANSDFRPVLAHWAPRDRFIRSQPTTVTQLYDSPLGIFTFLGYYDRNRAGAWRTPLLENPPVLVRRLAEDTAAGLDGKPALAGDDADLIAHGVAARLRELGAKCFAGESAKSSALLIMRAFQQSAPFLDDDALARAWDARAWSQCTEGMPPAVMQTLALTRALVRKDGAALEASARSLFDEHGAEIDDDTRIDAVYAGIFAAYLNRDADARDRWLKAGMDQKRWSERSKFRLKFVARVLETAKRSVEGRTAATVNSGVNAQ